MDPFQLISRHLHPQRSDASILELDLDLGVTAGPPANPLAALRTINAPAMRALVLGLRRGADDPLVKGLVIHVGACPYTATQLDEIAAAIEDFGRTRPVVSYTESFGEFGNSTLAYRFASVAHQIWLQPTGELGLSGIAMNVTLLRGSLDKLGIEPQFGQRHEYKTAADQLSAHEVTPANREMIQRIADSILEDTIATVASRRRMSVDDVRQIVNGPALTATDALNRGLIDHIGYRDQVYSAIREQWGRDAILRYAHRSRHERYGVQELAHLGRPAVALVPITGSIVSGRPQSNPGQQQASSEIVGQQLRRAAADPQVRAVVLRVDSPGGSYIASDAIRREVQQVRRTGKPVVASMGAVAASGGYFVAMPADEIVACPTTLTGSIGVLAGKIVLAGLTEKLGLVVEDIAAGPWASMMSSQVPFTEEQWEALNVRLDEIYADFTQKAADDRHLDVEALRDVARGRVWTGSDAQRHGLVDHLGGAELAIHRACALAGLDRDKVSVRPTVRFPLLERLRPAESSETSPTVVHAATWADLAAAGPDAAVRALAAASGLDLAGVLTMPWRIRLG